jgi:hypothetical protein
MTEPSPALRATILQLLADGLMDQYPGLDVTVVQPGDELPPGATLLPAGPGRREPVGDVGVPRPRNGRGDHDPQDG